MTHAELRTRYPAGALEPPDCPGELEEVGHFDPDPASGHEVRIYRCRGCRRVVVVDETKGEIRNDYRLDEPGSLESGQWSVVSGQ